MRHSPLVQLCAVLPCLLAATTMAAAAQVQYPFGDRLGLAPPAGLQRSANPPGFIDPDNKVSMLLLELPPGASLQVERSITTEAAKARGIILDHREALFTNAGMALVSAGEDTREHARKWMLVIALPDFTGVVSVQIPDAARDKYPDAAIRAALQSLSVRPPPVAEELQRLPYKLDALSGFRVARVFGQSGVLLVDAQKHDAKSGAKSGVNSSAKSAAKSGEPARLVIALGAGAPERPEERGNFARVKFADIGGFRDKKITSADTMHIDRQPAIEIRGTATDAHNGTPVTIVQWLRFGTRGYLQIIGVTPTADWPRDFPRFRAIRDGIENR